MVRREIEEIVTNVADIAKGIHSKGILVTGGAGFLGSWICDVLVEMGAKVICLDNLVSGQKANISHLIGKDSFKFMQHDITGPISFNEKIDVVMHLASRASPFEFEKHPIEILKANTLGTWVALGIAKRHEASFLYTSTSETYGDALEIPTSEEYRGNVSSLGPRSCYDESKRCGESYVMAYKLQHGLDTRIARIFNTYGPRMRADGVYGRVVPRFIAQALNNKPITVFGEGTQTRSFCYITDQIEGLLRLVFSPNTRGEVVNIGNDGEITIIELANMIKRLANSHSRIEFHPLPQDDPLRRKPDISKARRLLGWRPNVSLEEGLGRMIQWQKEPLKGKLGISW